MRNVLRVFSLIEKQAKKYNEPFVKKANARNTPFRILISCILSLRTKDFITAKASKRLFLVAHTAKSLANLSLKRIENLIYPVGFYRKKAKVLKAISEKLVNDFSGKVPDKEDELLSFYGIGRKTANLVLGLGYNIPAICVDTHVHRISNRLGWVRTNGVRETELALKKILPKSRWINLNLVLVTFGQNICVPVSPFCSRCLVGKFCKKAGVKRYR